MGQQSSLRIMPENGKDFVRENDKKPGHVFMGTIRTKSECCVGILTLGTLDLGVSMLTARQ